jgi:hypothetical protein
MRKADSGELKDVICKKITINVVSKLIENTHKSIIMLFLTAENFLLFGFIS